MSIPFRKLNLPFRLDFGLLTALVIPLLAIMPLLTHAGLPNTADGPAHLMRQVELNRAWEEGNFYPRWGTDLAFGHGMPIFSYAPPSLYQLTQLFHLAGLPLDGAMKAVLVLDFLLYSLGMFLLARRIYGPYPALIAAAVYVYAPYRLREAYIQGNYGQFTGLAFYPLIFWAFHGLISEGRRRYLVAAALALAGLLFSHNISFMLFAPVFGAYLLFLLVIFQKPDSSAQNAPLLSQSQADAAEPKASWGKNLSSKAAPFLQTAAAGLLGLGLAAIFWLPAFGERYDIKLEGITQGFFDFRENFVSLSELLAPPLPLDLAAINPEFPLSLGLAQLLGVGAGVLGLLVMMRRFQGSKSLSGQFSGSQTGRKQGTESRYNGPQAGLHTLFFALFFLIYAFLALPASQTLWETFPLIELAEFPWRMLGPAIFCASLLAAAGLFPWAAKLNHLSEGRRWLLMNGLLFLIVALNGYYLYPSQFIPWGTPTPADAFRYEISSGAIGTTSTGEFLPRWAQQHPRPETLWPDYAAGRPPQKVDPAGLPAGATVQTISHQAEADILDISTPTAFTATLRTLYWPGWQLYLDEAPLSFTVTPNTGLIQTAIPAGQHRLTLRLESTPLRTTGLWLTALSSLSLLAITFSSLYSSYRSRLTHHAPHTTPYISRPTPQFFILTALTLLALYLFSRPLAAVAVVRSDPDRPQPADRLLQVDFGDQIRLAGAEALPEIVTLPAEGEATLEVTLYWRALEELETNYSVFLHLDGPNGQTFATTDEVNPENIPTRNWPPGLYLRNPLHLKLSAGLPPIRYEVTTGLYRRDSGERLALQSDGSTSFRLGSLWLARPAASPPPEKVATFGPAVTLHGAELNGNTLTLLWQTDRPIEQEYSIFVHVLDPNHQLLSQADGVPYGGLYPLTHWLPGQLIEDIRPLDLQGQASQLAIGIYDPATGQRLPAVDSNGQPLVNDSFLVPVTHDQ